MPATSAMNRAVPGLRPMLAAVAVGTYAAIIRPRMLTWGATADEARRSYPGDELIAEATSQTTMAVTLPAPPEQVWPWLVQMGANRGGWYSWDLLDNAGRPSADRIAAEWQELKVDDHIDSVPSGASWFTVALIDRPRSLVLRADLELPSGRMFDPRGPMPAAYIDGIWGFHLSALSGDRTRLVVRTRGRTKPRAVARIADLVLGEPAHFIMQTRQFHNLRKRLSREAPTTRHGMRLTAVEPTESSA